MLKLVKLNQLREQTVFIIRNEFYKVIRFNETDETVIAENINTKHECVFNKDTFVHLTF